jgi:[acyl-carrier-protein] S-malonyltransferase
MTARATALVFPGQGSQSPGMGRALIEGGYQTSLLILAREQGIDLEHLLVDGDADELRPTEIAQPALFYSGVALGTILIEAGMEPVVAAGHSLGEYCAVVVAGSLTPEDGMRLVLERGRLMAAAPAGTMAAVLGLERPTLSELCLEAAAGGECCVIANDNSPGQLVVSGTRTGIERLGQLAKAAGAKRVLPLNVGGAFHSPLMADSAAAFSAVLDRVEIAEPRFPVAAGVSATISHSAAEIRTGLRLQLAGPVLWADTVRAMAATGVESFLECGPGTTLAGLIRRILPEAKTASVDSPESATRLLSESPAPGGQAAVSGRE